MLERNSELRRPVEFLTEEITLAPGETQEDRFKTWLAEKLATPRFCPRHTSTRLHYDHGWDHISAAHTNSFPREARFGVFTFRFGLYCRACRCAYALCPPEFCTTSFKTFDTSTPERANALARCREFAAQVNKEGCGFLQMLGLPGTGKTRLACNVVGALENGDALYVRQGQLTTALRATYGRKDVFFHRQKRRDDDDEAGGDEPPTPLEIVQGVRFLVLDEIGCAPLANDERLLLDELLKHRYDERKPTILISNLPLDLLKEFLGDALTDRIVSATGNKKFLLQFSGESFRRTTGEDYLGGLK